MRHLVLVAALLACNKEQPQPSPPVVVDNHGPMAEGIFAPMGEVVPYATDEQKATFERGLEVGLRRSSLGTGLGPEYNVTFCLSCHEKPTFGGAAGLYRNFFLTQRMDRDGVVGDVPELAHSGGVVRLYSYRRDVDYGRPTVPESANVVAKRNPMPTYGAGLIAELTDEDIAVNIDVDDEDGDGISGRANYDGGGFIGRFGRKAQTASIEAFIRGPLFNHLGVTTDPLDNDQRGSLPVDSSDPNIQGSIKWWGQQLTVFGQVGAPDSPLLDGCSTGTTTASPSAHAPPPCDDVGDPEMSTDDLFDLVSFTMLLAVPPQEELNDTTTAGLKTFDRVGCSKCHVPRLNGPHGPLPIYSDLLLHDMGEELADGLWQNDATGSEFRTQPLWGVASVGPFLHDGRAHTLTEAIQWHGGEAKHSKQWFMSLPESEQSEVLAFLTSLGGADQFTKGLIPPGEPVPSSDEWGGPVPNIDLATFEEGRLLFDREFGISEGVGSPRFNGDSCRACHFEPVVGGAGPRGVNVIRHGLINDDGAFVVPTSGTVLHRTTSLDGFANLPQPVTGILEHRQTPHLFGLGLIDGISDATIRSNADPDDLLTPDGITGRVPIVDGNRIGRFGWKGSVPSVSEFIRDAITTELGMTVPYAENMTFGRIQDNDPVADPEYSAENIELLDYYLTNLNGPPRAPMNAQSEAGELLFDEVGCTSCHIPELDGVPLYSDLLLHDNLPAGTLGIEDASATMTEFRTPPLWGVRLTAPYLHSGEADTLQEAVELHDGESVDVREAFVALTPNEQAQIIAFLETL